MIAERASGFRLRASGDPYPSDLDVTPHPRKRKRNLLFAGSTDAASDSGFLDGGADSE